MSIKAKIFLLLIVIPTLILGLFAWRALSIFESDKIAYVYDSTLASAKLLAGQTRLEIRELTEIIQKLILASDVGTKSINSEGEELYKKEPRLIGFWIFQIDPNQSPIPVLSLGSKALGWPAPKWLSTHYESFKDKDFLSATTKFKNDNAILIISRIKAPNETSVKYYTMSLFVNVFKMDMGTLGESILVSKDGLTRHSLQATGIPEDSPLIAQSQVLLSGTSYKDGTSSFRVHRDEYLAAVASVGIGDLFVTSAISKANATEATHLLITQAILFLIFLFAATIIISVFATKSLTEGLQKLMIAAGRISKGDFGLKLNVKSHDEIGQLTKSFNLMSTEVARLMSETVEKARMQAELNTAKTVQETLFPKGAAVLGSVEIAGHYEPASECGGDWWHYFEDEKFAYIMIGDATGHGAPAALLTSAAKSAISLVQKIKITSTSEILSHLNDALHATSHGKMLMTFFLARIDKLTGVLVYSIASHDAPILIRASIPNPTKDNLIHLNSGIGPRLGERQGTVYQESTIMLEPDDRIFFFTDGVYDVQNPSAKDLGERRMLKILFNALTQQGNSKNAVEVITEGLNSWRLQTPLNDDVTFILAKWKASATL